MRTIFLRLHAFTKDLALKGKQVPLAQGFTEWSIDVGPLAFLYNSDGSITESEIQLFGKPIFHAGFYMDEVGVYIPRLFVRYDIVTGERK